MVLVVILKRIVALIVSIVLLPVWIVMMIIDAIAGTIHTKTTMGRLWH